VVVGWTDPEGARPYLGALLLADSTKGCGNIWPTDRAPVIRHLEDGAKECSELRWGFPPARRRAWMR
jgi:putative SOS response-associated peptidase YedK